jgi:hypothetical protein
LLKEILFTAGGVSLLGFGVLSIHWNIREVVAYKTGIGRKVRVVKGSYDNDEVKSFRSGELEPLGKVQFSKMGVESTGNSRKLEVAKEPSYLHTQAVVGSVDDVIQKMLDKQDKVKDSLVPEVNEDMLEDVNVEVYEGTQVLVEEANEHTTVLVEDEEIKEHTIALAEDETTEHTTVLVEEANEHTTALEENEEDYFTTVLDNEPALDIEEPQEYVTQVLEESDIDEEYLTQVLVDDSDDENDDYLTQSLLDEDFEYVTQVLADVEDGVEENEEDTYVTQVLVEEPDFVTKVLVERADEEEYHTVGLNDVDGATGNVEGASVENEELVGVEGLEVLYTNYELESK